MSTSEEERRSGHASSDKDQSLSSKSESLDDLPLKDASNDRKNDSDSSDEESQKSTEPPDDRGALDDKPKSLIAVIMLALSLAVFLSALDITIVTVALPKIAEHFQSADLYTWVGSSFLLASAASTPLWGKVSDIFGRKPMLLLANAFFMIGSLICGAAINVGMMVTGRAIQGIASGGMLTLVDTIIGHLFSRRTRGTYLGIIGAVWALASALGPAVGGAFTSGISWRWCFYINLPLDAIVFLVILFFLKLNTPKTPLWDGIKAIDWLGTFTIVTGTILFLFGLQYGGTTFPWTSTTVVVLLIAGLLVMIIFFIVEWKLARYPIIPLRIFKYRSNCGVLLVVFFHSFVYISSFYFLPLYFQAIRGESPILAGVYTLPSVVSTGLSAAVSGAFIGATGKYLPSIYTGMACMILGYGLFMDLDLHSGWAKIIVYQIIAGIGNGPNFQAPLVALSTNIKQHDVAASTATYNFIRNFATSISVIAGQALYQNQLTKMQGILQHQVGSQAASLIVGGEGGAKSGLINQLPPDQRSIVREAFADSLQPMWIMYTAFAGAGFLCVLLIQSSVLTREHQQTDVGLEAEKRFGAQLRSEKEDEDVERELAFKSSGL